MDEAKITSDKYLAKKLRKLYFEKNRRWYKALKLRGLTTIVFVEFEVHQNRFTDIRACPAMPPLNSRDYIFEPADLIPPVGSQYLLHLFEHPEDYDRERTAYLRMPKKRGRLDAGVGYGISLVEGFLADRVWAFIVIIFVVGSLAFAVTWTCVKQDIQGAFGVAAWICTLAALTTGWVQTRLD
ncbi:hypothetical protein LTR16_003441 [Cryomyces antarcticus]|uniref:Uncharacterized protein n=1 Tax=Cryomyces antarcticus TaxID=329879 RepID=A0ABR0LY59_9PEZI|nr:hypothetical protein LTR60_002655 [Cryomyces antarcticus]KAK5256355.1 hypothetical protein LTR16_003441 [Cryomyces antarcticus]